ncbi:hypothetical protein [Aquihabitans sp. McL0605]|uniref:hypothetical protein n=1 Tax=Aquihabitans sp. McL0605 TaxID=3415671 RepID=UPI003CF03FAD
MDQQEVSRPGLNGPGPKQRTARASLALALAVLLSSCSWTSGDQYFVHWGAPRDDVVLRERTSWDLTLAQRLFYANNDAFADQMAGFKCHGNRSSTSADRCVMKLLHDRTQISGFAGGVWRRATSDAAQPGMSDPEPRLTDFRDAFSTVRSSRSDSLELSACLTLSVPVVGGSNWTTRGRTNGDCRTGKHVWE